MIEWMKNLTLTEWSLLSQIVLTIITFLGIVTSMWLSRRTLREIQIDRKLRQKPYLAFEPGGQKVFLEFKAVGKAIPGINPQYAQKVLANSPDDAESVYIKSEEVAPGMLTSRHYGSLKNYGLGPALSTRVTWVPKEISIGSDSFSLDQRKLSEPIYGEGLNRLPADPSHILPGQEAQLTRLPTFIVVDYQKKINKVIGVLLITYEDVFGDKYYISQIFRIRTAYTNNKPYLIVTFSDLVDDENSQE